MGVREDSEDVILADGDDCANHGIMIRRSPINFLVSGGENGATPPRFTTQVVLLRNGRILYTQPGVGYEPLMIGVQKAKGDR